MRKTLLSTLFAAVAALLLIAACGGEKDYTGTYEAVMYGMRMGMTLNADGTATSYSGDEKNSGYFWEAAEKNGKVLITVGTKGPDGQFTKSGSHSYLYEEDKLVSGQYTYTKKPADKPADQQ